MSSYGYIRQSRRADLDVALSPQAQLDAIKRLASRYGDDPDSLTILQDLGRSGAKEKTHLRESYRQLIKAIETNGHGTTIYALSMSRLARSLSELFNIFSLAAEHGVRIIFEKEGEVRFDTPIGKLHATITGAVYEFERELSVERMRDNIAVRRARGERMGRVPYGEKDGEDIAQIFKAYRLAGSFNGAATLLNSWGVATRIGKPWAANSVKSVLVRTDPTIERSSPKRQGAKAVSGFRLYRILRCHCGSIMTASHKKNNVYYRCHAADSDPQHAGQKSVAENTMLPKIEDELGDLANLVMKIDQKKDKARQEELTAKRARIVEAFLDGVINKQERAQRLVEIDDELSTIDVEDRLITIPSPFEEPSVVNPFLRDFFGVIQMDQQMQPTFDWKAPSLRNLRDRIDQPSLLTSESVKRKISAAN